MSKKVYIDTETTGLDCKINGIWQIGAIVEVDGVIVERLAMEFKPIEGKIISGEALAKSGITIEYLRNLELTPRQAYLKLVAALGRHIDKFKRNDKAIILGYNLMFDYQFLRQWFLDLGDKYFGSWFWHPYVDIQQTANQIFLQPDQNTGIPRRFGMENFKLGTVCREMNLEFNDNHAHDAMYDIEKTRELHLACCEKLGIRL